MTSKQLLKGGIVLSMDADVGDFDRGDVLIEGARIADVGKNIDAPEAEVIDASEMIVMPGFVDTHRHLWYTPLRNVSCDLTLWPFFQRAAHLVPQYRAEWVYAAGVLGAMDALAGGITTVMDWCHIINSPAHADAAINGLKEVGVRARFVYGQPPGWEPPAGELGLPEDALRVQREFFCGEEGLLTYCIGLRGPQYDDFNNTCKDVQAARDHSIPISWHIATEHALRDTDPIGQLQREGMLGPDINHVHATFASDAEFEAIAVHGGSVSICPIPEQIMGFGDPPLRRAIRNGVKPGLGLDACVAGGGHLFDDMHSSLMAYRRQEAQGVWAAGKSYTSVSLTTRDVLKLATIGGARSVWLDQRVGSLTPGKDADVIMIRTTDYNILPVMNVQDAVWAATCSAKAGNVDSVWVAGKRVKEAGMMTIDVDFERALALAREARTEWATAETTPLGAGHTGQ